jgi:hypothetical protein
MRPPLPRRARAPARGRRSPGPKRATCTRAPPRRPCLGPSPSARSACGAGRPSASACARRGRRASMPARRPCRTGTAGPGRARGARWRTAAREWPPTSGLPPSRSRARSAPAAPQGRPRSAQPCMVRSRRNDRSRAGRSGGRWRGPRPCRPPTLDRPRVRDRRGRERAAAHRRGSRSTSVRRLRLAPIAPRPYYASGRLCPSCH